MQWEKNAKGVWVGSVKGEPVAYVQRNTYGPWWVYRTDGVTGSTDEDHNDPEAMQEGFANAISSATAAWTFMRRTR